MCTSEQAFTDRLDWTEETFFSPLCDTWILNFFYFFHVIQKKDFYFFFFLVLWIWYIVSEFSHWEHVFIMFELTLSVHGDIYFKETNWNILAGWLLPNKINSYSRYWTQAFCWVYFCDSVQGYSVWRVHFAKSTTWQCLNITESINLILSRP